MKKRYSLALCLDPLATLSTKRRSRRYTAALRNYFCSWSTFRQFSNLLPRYILWGVAIGNSEDLRAVRARICLSVQRVLRTSLRLVTQEQGYSGEDFKAMCLIDAVEMSNSSRRFFILNLSIPF